MNALVCREFVELVTSHLDGALDHRSAERFLAHLVACDGCDRYLEQVRVAIGLLAQGSEPGK